MTVKVIDHQVSNMALATMSEGEKKSRIELEMAQSPVSFSPTDEEEQVEKIVALQVYE